MSVITLHLGRRFESTELHLRLPAAPEEIEEKLTWLDDYAEDLSKPVELRDVSCEIVGIRQYLRQADLSREGELDKLNALAGKIADMDWRQRDLLWGALDCESIGLEYRSEHGGSFNGGGYVRKKDMDRQMEEDSVRDDDEQLSETFPGLDFGQTME